jgi:uncharacterized membrane protein YccC
LQNLALLVDRLAEYTQAAAEAAAGEQVLPLERTDRREWLSTLRHHLKLRSPVLRHALRLCVVAGLAVAIGVGFHLRNPQWITVTAIAILQPWAGTTFRRGLQRVAGTMAGAGLAAVLAALVRHPGGLVALIFVFAVAAVSLLPMNYAAFSMFLTPTFVLLAEVQGGDWHVAGARLIDTIIGSALAIAGTRLLWPSPERRRFPIQAASALLATRTYLERVCRDEASPRIRQARLGVGVAVADAETSAERVVEEEHRGVAELEPLLMVATYARRLSAAIASIASVRREHRFHMEALERNAGGSLLVVATALAKNARPEPLPEPLVPETGDDALVQSLEHRIARQVRAIHGAVSRAAAAGSTS